MDFYRKIDAKKQRGQWNIRFLLSIFFTIFRIHSTEFKVRSNCELDFFLI